jgi:hypothetical protein
VIALIKGGADGDARIDMGIYHTLRHLLAGVMDAQVVNQLNSSAINVGR